MPFLDTFRGKKFKTELETVQADLQAVQVERDRLKAMLAETERMTYAELQQAITEMTATRDQLTQDIEALRAKYQQEQETLELQMKGFQARKQEEQAEIERRCNLVSVIW